MLSRAHNRELWRKRQKGMSPKTHKPRTKPEPYSYLSLRFFTASFQFTFVELALVSDRWATIGQRYPRCRGRNLWWPRQRWSPVNSKIRRRKNRLLGEAEPERISSASPRDATATWALSYLCWRPRFNWADAPSRLRLGITSSMHRCIDSLAPLLPTFAPNL